MMLESMSVFDQRVVDRAKPTQKNSRYLDTKSQSQVSGNSWRFFGAVTPPDSGTLRSGRAGAGAAANILNTISSSKNQLSIKIQWLQHYLRLFTKTKPKINPRSPTSKILTKATNRSIKWQNNVNKNAKTLLIMANSTKESSSDNNPTLG